MATTLPRFSRRCSPRVDATPPSLIPTRTHLGYGSPHKHDTFAAHGSPLGVDEVPLTKQTLGWPVEPPFLIPESALVHFRGFGVREHAMGAIVNVSRRTAAPCPTARRSSSSRNACARRSASPR